MELISHLYKQSPRLFLFSSTLGVLSGLCNAVLMGIINEAMHPKKDYPFKLIAFLFFSTCLLQTCFKIISEIQLIKLSQEISYQLVLSLSKKILETPQKTLQKLGKNNLLVMMTKDIETISQGSQQLALVMVNSITILTCLGYLFWLSWKTLLLLSSCIFIGMYIYHIAERKPIECLEHVRLKTDELYKHLQSIIFGSRELQINKKYGEKFITLILQEVASDIQHFLNKGIASYIWISNIGSLSYLLALGIVLFIVPLWVQQASVVTTGVTIVLLFLVQPIAIVMGILPFLQKASIALSQIHKLNQDLSTTITSPIDVENNPFVTHSSVHLTLEDVYYHYPAENEEHPFEVGPLNLTLSTGEILFIVGGNGSGKTTLAMLLLGLYEPNRGTIVLNGIQVTPNTMNNYRKFFSVIFSDFYLFEYLFDTEQEAIQLKAENYLKLLHLHHKVKITNGKFSTTELSAGQRKRLALVMAYLEDRPIYLFDEWAADQDPEFKDFFYKILLPDLKAKGKAIIAITHDDHYFSCADRIIKLESGCIKNV
jgi:putative pyoverdin transport system ATP-binding/permease protein